MFAYCANNPVRYIDETGTFFTEVLVRSLIAGVAGAIVAIASGATTEGVWDSFIKGAFCGAISSISAELSICLFIANLGITYFQSLMDGLTSNEAMASMVISTAGQIALPETGTVLTDELIDFTFGVIADMNATFVQEALKEDNTSKLTSSGRSYVFHALVSVGFSGGSYTTSCIDSAGGIPLWKKP